MTEQKSGGVGIDGGINRKVNPYEKDTITRVLAYGEGVRAGSGY